MKATQLLSIESLSLHQNPLQRPSQGLLLHGLPDASGMGTYSFRPPGGQFLPAEFATSPNTGASGVHRSICDSRWEISGFRMFSINKSRKSLRVVSSNCLEFPGRLRA